MITFIVDIKSEPSTFKYIGSDNVLQKLSGWEGYKDYFETFISSGCGVQVFTISKEMVSRRFFEGNNHFTEGKEVEAQIAIILKNAK